MNKFLFYILLTLLPIIFIGTYFFYKDMFLKRGMLIDNVEYETSNLGGDPFSEILSYGIGAYSGNCLSVSSGLTTDGTISLSQDANQITNLDAFEFKTKISSTTHLVSITQNRTGDTPDFTKAEWLSSSILSEQKDKLLLRFDSSLDKDLNIAHSTEELTLSKRGLTCRNVDNKKLAQKDALVDFLKYLKNPKTTFSQCVCIDKKKSANVAVPINQFSCNGKDIFIGQYKFKIPESTTEQSFTFNPGDKNKSFFMNLSLVKKKFLNFTFNDKNELSMFMGDLGDNVLCICQTQ